MSKVVSPSGFPSVQERSSSRIPIRALPKPSALTELPWNFEAFRNFLNFEVLQQAAATLELYDGLAYTEEPSRTAELGETLCERTGLQWLPKREVEERVLFDPEGSVFRNKARVLTSMGILDVEALRTRKTISLSTFGRELGQGIVSREDFYERVVTTFKYPHLAYDGGKQWEEANASVRPFVLIIRVLIELVRIDPDENKLTSKEFVEQVTTLVPDFDPKRAADEIVDIRRRDAVGSSGSSTAARRNATDLFGFLCITGFTYFIAPGTIALNLVSVSKKDKTHFWLRNREGESSLDRIEEILERNSD